GNVCPLTRITTTTIVPLRKPVPLESNTSKHMTEDRSQLINFVQKFLVTVNFRNDHVAKIMGYGDYKIGNVTILRVYYGVDLLTGSRGNNLYTLSLGDMMASSHICLLSKVSKTKSWLWHRRLSHLNFGAINHLARQGLVRDFIIKFLKMIQVRLKVPVCCIQTDNGTEFVNKTLRECYEQVSISHETSVARSPQQNDVVERWKLQPKADIRIFIGYAPTKKAFWIYNRRTRRIVETIHVDFDELTAMASEQSSSGPALNEMTPATISSGLMPGQLCNPITRFHNTIANG
nr:hypothetical protein [Tanacetum cinerariifolium]